MADMEGRVLTVSRDGLGFVEDIDTNRRYPFTFDKIEGYKGETLKELEARGIQAGSRVGFFVTYDKGVITKIYPIAEIPPTECPACGRPITKVPVSDNRWELDCPSCGYNVRKDYSVGRAK